MATLSWGILGTGSIAHTFAQGLAHSSTGKLVAVGSRTRESAERFGREFHIARCHGSYEALLADPHLRAVYIATPHPMHAQWAINAMRAGKHVLCEKPLGMNAAEAAAIIEAARANGVFLMEAFMYRCHPQTHKLVELLRKNVIGQVRLIQATFSFRGSANETGRLLSRELGGGGILDVGCYPVSLARLVTGVATGGTFAEPVDLKAVAHVGPTGVDEWSAAVARFPGDILAQLGTGVQVQQENTVRIYGSEGDIFIPFPWAPARDGGTWRMFLHRDAEDGPREISGTAPFLYTIEADVVATNIDRRQAPFPAMTWDDSMGNMRMLDRWRESIGLRYDCEPGT